jgi:UV DNA damage repair endonuclease
MQQEDQFTVVLGEKHIVVDKRIAEVSQYLHNLLSMGLDEEEVLILTCRYRSTPTL